MFEVSFRYRHGCPVGRLSEAHPDLTIVQLCNYRLEVLEFPDAPPGAVDGLLDELARLSKRRYRPIGGHTGKSGRLALLKCPHTRGRTISGLIERHGCLYLPPLVYKAGWEHYRIIAFTPKQFEALYPALRARGDIEISGKRPLRDPLMSRTFTITANQLMSGLTAKQASALLAAIEDGYYEVPRRVRTEDIARRRRVPRTTFEDHMRKAEAKLIQAVAPFVSLYASGAS